MTSSMSSCRPAVEAHVRLTSRGLFCSKAPLDVSYRAPTVSHTGGLIQTYWQLNSRVTMAVYGWKGSLFSLTKRATGTFLPVSTPVVNIFSVYCVDCVAAGAPAEGSLLSLRQQSTGLLPAEGSALRRCLRNSFRLPRYQKRDAP